jgi:hypothetical protein
LSIFVVIGMTILVILRGFGDGLGRVWVILGRVLEVLRVSRDLKSLGLVRKRPRFLPNHRRFGYILPFLGLEKS